MPIDPSNYIGELLISEPGDSDDLSEGANQIRTTKRSVKNSFPNFVGTTATPKTVNKTEDQLTDCAEKSQAETIGGQWTFSARLILNNGSRVPNSVDYECENAAATAIGVMRINGSDECIISDSSLTTRILGSVAEIDGIFRFDNGAAGVKGVRVENVQVGVLQNTDTNQAISVRDTAGTFLGYIKLVA